MHELISLEQKYKKALQEFTPTLNHYLSVISVEITREISPISIYLTGSFGRGEGSLYRHRTNVTPIRDFDILVIVKRHIKGKIIDRITKRIHTRLSIDLNSKNFKLKGFIIWITQATIKDLNAFSLLKFYELKKTSRLLFGEDIRYLINISFKDLSKYNGILILFGKIQGLLGLLDFDALKKGETKKLLDFVYECLKTRTEIGTTHGILTEIYEPNFTKRCNTFYNDFHNWFPELEEFNPKLPFNVLQCSYRRLLIDDEFLESIDLSDMVAETVRDLDTAIWLYIKQAYSIDMPHILDDYNLLESYLEILNVAVLKDLMGFYIKNKLGFTTKLLEELTARVYLWYALLRFVISVRRAGYSINLRVLFARHKNIMMRLWLIGLLFLKSLKEDSSIDKDILQECVDRLCEILDHDILREYETIRELDQKFTFLQKILVDLLEIADRVFHKKD